MGKTMAFDRHACSGVAFLFAKKEAMLSMDWCEGPDTLSNMDLQRDGDSLNEEQFTRD